MMRNNTSKNKEYRNAQVEKCTSAKTSGRQRVHARVETNSLLPPPRPTQEPDKAGHLSASM